MLIKAYSSTTTQHLHNFKFPFVSKLIHNTVGLLLCVMLFLEYACAHVSFPAYRLQLTVWEQLNRLTGMHTIFVNERLIQHHASQALHSTNCYTMP